jgi:hypothetical protein
MHPFPFTFRALEACFATARRLGYHPVDCRGYVEVKRHGLRERTLVTRVDIDLSPKKARRLGAIFEQHEIPATFFVRLHAKEYNPFSFENYRVLRQLRDAGHEIGYHSEVVDQAAIWDEPAASCLERDLEVLNRMLGIRVEGVASHGGMTGLNNLDFWKERHPSEYGLLYEAYDRQPEFDLFHEARYVSDANWTHWKCYEKGVLREGDHRTPGEHMEEGVPLLYLLIHPETYYDEHFYE